MALDQQTDEGGEPGPRVQVALWIAARSPLGRLVANGRAVSVALSRARLPVVVSMTRVAVVVAALLALVMLEGLAFDGDVVERSRVLPAGVTEVFRFATRFGQSDWLLIPAALVVIAVALGDWRGPRRAVAAAWVEIGAFAATFFVAIALPGLLSDIVKPLVGRIRPDSVDADGTGFHPLALGYAHASFPSGHANTMAAVAVVMTMALGARALPVVVFAMVVAMSRAVIGVHYFSDVVAGVLLGGIVAYGVVRGAASARLGFTADASGKLSPRLEAARLVSGRRGGVRQMLRGLWVALAGR